MPAVHAFAESAARAQVMEAAIRHAHPHAEINAYLEAHGQADLITAPALGATPSLAHYRRLRDELRALVHGASPALRRTIATVETISPTFAGLGDDQ